MAAAVLPKASPGSRRFEIRAEIAARPHLRLLVHAARRRIARGAVCRRACLTLSGTRLLGGIPKPEAVVFEEAHRHLYRTVLRSSDDVATGNEVRQGIAHRIAYLGVMAQPVARSSREQVKPTCAAVAKFARHAAIFAWARVGWLAPYARLRCRGRWPLARPLNRPPAAIIPGRAKSLRS